MNPSLTARGAIDRSVPELVAPRAVLCAFLVAGGCVSNVGIGGGFGRSSTPPDGDGLHVRIGAGAGHGFRQGGAQVTAEFYKVGDIDAFGGAFETGLHLWTPRSLFDEPTTPRDKRLREALGRTLGGGVALRARVFAGAVVDHEGGEILNEIAVGVGYDRTYEEAGPESIDLYASVFRVSLNGEDDRWAFGVSIGGTVPWQSFPVAFGAL